VYIQNIGGMPLVISQRVREKLASKIPPVTQDEIAQCFADRTGDYLIDVRAENQTDPPTQWFIAETFFGRKLKVVFMQDGQNVIIKTAYPPNAEEVRIYNKYSAK
jgi:hypothetical protein